MFDVLIISKFSIKEFNSKFSIFGRKCFNTVKILKFFYSLKFREREQFSPHLPPPLCPDATDQIVVVCIQLVVKAVAGVTRRDQDHAVTRVRIRRRLGYGRC